MKRYNGIDLFRFIGAFFIMLLHTSYGNLNPVYAQNIRLCGRWAVPFFFLITGYFLFKKLNKTSEVSFSLIEKNVAKLISILIIASIIYLPFVYLGRTPMGIENIFTGTSEHLWFIGSIIFGYVFIWYFYFRKWEKSLPLVSILFLCLAILTDSYDTILGLELPYDIFRFTLSIPFMFIGGYISKVTIHKKWKYLFLALFFFGFFLQYAEANLLLQHFNYPRYSHQFLIGTIFSVVPLFIFVSLLDIKETRFSVWGRDYSLFMYLYHPFAYLVFDEIIKQTAPSLAADLKVLYPIVAFMVTLALAILLRKYLSKVYNILNGDFI